MYIPSEEYRQKVAWIESKNNPFAQNPKSSAKGKYQFIDKTAKAYGLKDPFDEKQADHAFDLFTADNHKALKEGLGREPTDGELYLAHQQGAAGALKLLQSPDEKAVDVVGGAHVGLNGGHRDMTAKEFASMWTSKVDNLGKPKLNENAQAIALGMDSAKTRMAGGAAQQTADAGNIQNDAGPQPNKIDLMLEAERRGLLPPDKLSMLAEARKRGLIPAGGAQPEAPKEPGFIDRVKAAEARNTQKLQISAQEEAKGNQTPAETILQNTGNAVSLAYDIAGEGLKSLGNGLDYAAERINDLTNNYYKGAGKYVSDSLKSSRVGRDLAGAKDYLATKYSEFEKDHPRAARNIDATTNIGLLGLSAAPVKNALVAAAPVVEQGAKVVAQGAVSTAKKSVEAVRSASGRITNPLKNTMSKEAIVTSDEARKMAGPLFKEAERLGGTLSPDVTKKFIEKVDEIAPKTASKVEGGAGVVAEYRDLLIAEKSGQPLSLESIKNMDEHLGDLISGEIKTNGKMTNKGRQLMEIQDHFRDITNEAAAADTVGKTAEAFDAWRRGQSVWADSYRLKDIEDIFNRAKDMDNEAMSIKTQFKNLEMNPKRFNKYNEDQKALIRKAANRSLKVDALRLIGSRLISTGIGYSGGGLAGAAVAYPIGAAARAGAAEMQAAPGKKLLRDISKNVKETAKPNPLVEIGKRNNQE